MIKISDAKRIVKRVILANLAVEKRGLSLTPLLSGRHGIGKSMLVKQVADDISWYYEENERIKTQMSDCKVHIKHFGPETVIVGNQKRKESSYHANLQDVLI